MGIHVTKGIQKRIKEVRYRLDAEYNLEVTLSAIVEQILEEDLSDIEHIAQALRNAER